MASIPLMIGRTAIITPSDCSNLLQVSFCLGLYFSCASDVTFRSNALYGVLPSKPGLATMHYYSLDFALRNIKTASFSRST
jgi:hypothetical protein